MNPQKQSICVAALEWFGILAGPIAWLSQFEINYALVRAACIHHSKMPLHFISLIFFVIVVCAGVVSVSYFFKTREHSASGEELSARPHFMALLGILSASLYALAIVMQAVASFILSPCQR